MSMGLEQLQYGVNMASAIRLSPSQLPKLYNRLPPICKKLGIEQPEFYLSMDPNPNAWTFGDTKIFITITSGLVDMMTEEELDAVIAHECGHILCHHVLYHSIAHYVMDGLDSLGVLGSLGAPLQYAILYWEVTAVVVRPPYSDRVTILQVVIKTKKVSILILLFLQMLRN